MGYDNEAQAAIMAEPRVFMSGLSDEAGAAQPLAMASKQLGLPVASEIEKLESYVHETLIKSDSSKPGKEQFIQVGHLTRLVTKLGDPCCSWSLSVCLPA